MPSKPKTHLPSMWHDVLAWRRLPNVRRSTTEATQRNSARDRTQPARRLGQARGAGGGVMDVLAGGVGMTPLQRYLATDKLCPFVHEPTPRIRRL